mmetsp:Transcript_131561/g.420883  ORF Transcript_131561/g.420883 Transcript_131561/m.420883 type:complete len:250 (-) Transcript_131561:129-878(-)
MANMLYRSRVIVKNTFLDMVDDDIQEDTECGETCFYDSMPNTPRADESYCMALPIGETFPVVGLARFDRLKLPVNAPPPPTPTAGRATALLQAALPSFPLFLPPFLSAPSVVAPFPRLPTAATGMPPSSGSPSAQELTPASSFGGHANDPLEPYPEGRGQQRLEQLRACGKHLVRPGVVAPGPLAPAGQDTELFGQVAGQQRLAELRACGLEAARAASAQAMLRMAGKQRPMHGRAAISQKPKGGGRRA